MTTQTPTAAPAIPFTHGEIRALRRMRRQYRQDRDLLSEQERARLRFYRWLYQSGHWVP